MKKNIIFVGFLCIFTFLLLSTYVKAQGFLTQTYTFYQGGEIEAPEYYSDATIGGYGDVAGNAVTIQLIRSSPYVSGLLFSYADYNYAYADYPQVQPAIIFDVFTQRSVPCGIVIYSIPENVVIDPNYDESLENYPKWPHSFSWSADPISENGQDGWRFQIILSEENFAESGRLYIALYESIDERGFIKSASRVKIQRFETIIPCRLPSDNEEWFIFKHGTIPGSGTLSDPYRISSGYHLSLLRRDVNHGDAKTGKYFKLMNDIDLHNNEWIPIGSESSKFPFNGIFLGQNFTLKNLKISYAGLRKFNTALFGYTGKNAKIQNVTLSNVNIKGNLNVASLVAKNHGEVIECEATNVTLNYDAFNGNNTIAGGLVANNVNTGGIYRCSAQGKSYILGIVGGICGINSGNINNCFSNVALYGSSVAKGGIIGFQNTSNPVENCYSRGIIGSQGDQCGGIVGDISSAFRTDPSTALRIKNCVVLMSSIWGIGRICGNEFVYVENCYANKNLLLKNIAISVNNSNPNCFHGRDIDTIIDGKDPVFWHNRANFDYGTIWTTGMDGYPKFRRLGYDIPYINPCEILGTGTYFDPCKIERVCQLETLRNEVNNGDDKTGKVYILTNDLDFYGEVWIDPIGNNKLRPFNGIFLGQNHILKNLFIPHDGLSASGLFGNVGNKALIRNIIISDAVAPYGGDTISFLVAINRGKIEECAVINSTLINIHEQTGLLVAINEQTGVITKCYVQGRIENENHFQGCGWYSYAGPICGDNYGSIDNCYSKTDIVGGYRAGGIIANNKGGVISNCYAMGAISEAGDAAGICYSNLLYQQSKIKNCVSLHDFVIGEMGSGFRITSTEMSHIENCYAYAFMYVGWNQHSNNPNSKAGCDIYWMQMEDESFWKYTVGFDFSNIWKMGYIDGQEGLRPVFKWFPEQYLTQTKTIKKPSKYKDSLLLSFHARLDQNIPNPFKEKTIIGYYIPDKTKQAELYIYNLAGQLVKRISIDSHGEGEYILSSKEITKGLYIYTLIIDGRRISNKKMILVE